MAKVKVTHPDLTSDEAKVPPPRTPVDPGVYECVIASAALGVTTHTNKPLQKLSIEYQILYRLTEEGDQDEQMQGRRVYQDYVLEDEPSNPNISKLRRFELRQLLDATGIPYDEEGFDSDHLINNTVRITVRHRTGKVADPDSGKLPVFSNVTKVDTAEDVSDDDLV